MGVGSIKGKNLNRNEILIYFAIVLYCGALFFKRTTMPFDEFVLNKVMTIGALCAFLNTIIDKGMSLKQWGIVILVGGTLFINSLPTGNHELLYLFFIILGCRNCNKENIMKFIYFLVLALSIFMLFCVLSGIAPNERFVLDGWRERYCLGYNVWSILPFQYMSLCFFYSYFKKDIIKIKDVLILSFIAVPIYLLSDTKSGLSFTVAGMFLLYIIDKIKIRKWHKLLWLQWIPEIMFIISVVISFAYLHGSDIAYRINKIITYRIQFAAIAFQEFEITWLANPAMVEFYEHTKTYFAIDNNYLNLLFSWGITSVIIVCIIYTCIIRNCILSKNKRLLIIVIMYAVIGFVWSRMLVLIEVEFLIYFSELFTSRKNIGQEKFGE